MFENVLTLLEIVFQRRPGGSFEGGLGPKVSSDSRFLSLSGSIFEGGLGSKVSWESGFLETPWDAF